MMPEDSPVSSDVRISIGTGNVDSPIRTLSTARGEAFLLSGRALDTLEKTQGRLIITTAHELGTIAFSVLSDYLNSIFRYITSKQAEVMLELLKGNSQQQVAEKLNRSKSTISQHVTAGRWDEIEKILENYQKIVRLLSL
jgi:transcriptional antiterminator